MQRPFIAWCHAVLCTCRRGVRRPIAGRPAAYHALALPTMTGIRVLNGLTAADGQASKRHSRCPRGWVLAVGRWVGRAGRLGMASRPVSPLQQTLFTRVHGTGRRKLPKLPGPVSSSERQPCPALLPAVKRLARVVSSAGRAGRLRMGGGARHPWAR